MLNACRRSQPAGAYSMRRDGLPVSDVADVLAISEPQARRDIIIGAVEAGQSAAEAGRLVGVSRAYAARIARADGLTHAKRRRERARQVAWLAQSGLSPAEIADAVGLKPRTIRVMRRAR